MLYIRISVYNCSAMANGDCSKCRGLYYDATRSKFNCQWCRNGCQSPVTCDGSALNTCPPPTIHKVLPILSFIHVSDTAFYLRWFSDVGRWLWWWTGDHQVVGSTLTHCTVDMAEVNVVNWLLTTAATHQSLESVLSRTPVPLHGTQYPNTSVLNLTFVFLGHKHSGF